MKQVLSELSLSPTLIRIWRSCQERKWIWSHFWFSVCSLWPSSFAVHSVILFCSIKVWDTMMMMRKKQPKQREIDYIAVLLVPFSLFLGQQTRSLHLFHDLGGRRVIEETHSTCLPNHFLSAFFFCLTPCALAFIVFFSFSFDTTLNQWGK